MGTWPLTVLGDWHALCADIRHLPSDLVSLTLVTDPFGADLPAVMEGCFDVVRPFKPHYVIDLSVPAEERTTRHHRRQVRRSLEAFDVEATTEPLVYLDEWAALYRHTVERHGLAGIKAFSKASFEEQLRLPGTVMFRAAGADGTVAASLWFHDGEVAYGHLVGVAPDGYRGAAPYLLIWRAAEWFSGQCRWLDLGGVAGARHEPASGLAAFKAGWTQLVLPTYLCGLVLDHDAYVELAGGVADTEYFPAYRAGELS